MGRNFYFKRTLCKWCGNSDYKHIGKSSAGWNFSLHVYPDEGINDLQDWIDLWNKTWREEGLEPFIQDEYGSPITVEEILKIITERSWAGKKTDPRYFDQYTERDPNSELLRRKIDGFSCIGHGSGPWDLLISDFS